MSARRLLLVSVALLLLPSSGVRAQQCTPDDSPLTCWRKYNVVLKIKAPTAQKVATTNSGTPTATTLATATALRDFLSFFSAGVDTGKVTENGTSVTLDWNVPFPFVEDSDRIKLQALFSDPSLAEDVQTPLGSKSNAAKDKLTNFDDITTLISYSPVNRRLGRSLAPHVAFLDALESVNVPDDVELATANFAVELGKLKKLNKVPPAFFDGQGQAKFSTITDDAARDEVITLVEAIAAKEKVSAARSSSIVTALTRLINNQPQAYVSGTYHYRNPLVGPDEWSVKATFEIAPKSLNRFLGSNAEFCGEEQNAAKLTNGIECANKLVSFAGVADPSRQPDAGDRLSFAIEYRQAKGESVDLSEFMITSPVARKKTHSLVYSVVYGHPLTGVLKDARVDVAVNYDDISNDPKKKDRFVASLTFSQKISDTMTLPLSVTYANHTEYLPQTDRRFGVHFGISYRIPDSSGK